MVNPEMLLFGVASPYAWDVLESARRLELVAVCFDNVGGADSRLPLIDQLSMPSVPFILGISSAVNRVLAARDAFGRGLSIPTSMIDPTATVASTSVVGHGSYVNAGAVVASNTRITCHVNVNRSASVGHDNVLAFGSSIGPGATLAGSVSIESGAFIGAGAVVLPGRTIATQAVVGAGSVVTRDVGPGETVVGNPARVVRTLDIMSGVGPCPHC